MKSVAAFWTWGGRVSKTCVRAYVCRCHACIYLLAKEGDLEMLVEDVSPASDQPQSWDVGRPLATLVTLEYLHGALRLFHPSVGSPQPQQGSSGECNRTAQETLIDSSGLPAFKYPWVERKNKKPGARPWPDQPAPSWSSKATLKSGMGSTQQTRPLGE
eukprot:1157327-Pelagomonas_calceolata.AAC.9